MPTPWQQERGLVKQQTTVKWVHWTLPHWSSSHHLILVTFLDTHILSQLPRSKCNSAIMITTQILKYTMSRTNYLSKHFKNFNYFTDHGIKWWMSDAEIDDEIVCPYCYATKYTPACTVCGSLLKVSLQSKLAIRGPCGPGFTSEAISRCQACLWPICSPSESLPLPSFFSVLGRASTARLGFLTLFKARGQSWWTKSQSLRALSTATFNWLWLPMLQVRKTHLDLSNALTDRFSWHQANNHNDLSCKFGLHKRNKASLGSTDIYKLTFQTMN